MHPFFRQDESGKTTIRWSFFVALLAVQFFSYYIVAILIHYFAGRHLRIERFLMGFLPMTIPVLILLYLYRLRAHGKSANRFSLATLLGAFTIVCIVLGIVSWQRQTDLAVHAKRQRLETTMMSIIGQGTVRVSSSTLIQVKRPTFSDDDLARIVQLQPQLEAIDAPITMIDLSGTKISDHGVGQLRAIDSLEYCFLGQTGVTDASLEALGALPKLKILGLDSTRVTGEGKLTLSKLLPKLVIQPTTYRRLDKAAATTKASKKGEHRTGKQ